MRLTERITKGPIGVGTSFSAEMTGKARVVPMTIQFTEFDRPRRLERRIWTRLKLLLEPRKRPLTCCGC
jgi:hypothetical protein